MPLLALKNARAAAEDGYRTLAALGREEAQQRERTIHRWTYPTYQSVASWRTADIQARVSPPNSGPVSIRSGHPAFDSRLSTQASTEN